MKAHEELLDISTYPTAPVSHWWSLDRSSHNLLCSTLPPHCLGCLVCLEPLSWPYPWSSSLKRTTMLLRSVLIASKPISKVRSHRKLERDCNFNTNYNVKLGRRQLAHQNNYEVSFLGISKNLEKVCVKFAKVARWGKEDDFYVCSFWKVHIKYIMESAAWLECVELVCMEDAWVKNFITTHVTHVVDLCRGLVGLEQGQWLLQV